MSVIEEPPVVHDDPLLERHDPSVTASLDQLTSEVRRQGRQIKAAQQAFSIFAFLAFALAMVTLLAVVFKLDRKPQTVVQRVTTPSSSAAAPGPVLPHNVDVTLAQFAVTPSVKRAAAGNVTFRVHNAGTITHEFVVIKTSHLAADLPLSKGRADEAGNVGETGDLRPGRTKSVSLKLAPGHYALICNLPGHYLAGQHTDFTVR